MVPGPHGVRPRALGNRSILGNPCRAETQKKLNLKIKYREGFRPFAPSVLEEDIQEYFDLDRPSPYMLLVAPVQEKRRIPLPEGYDGMKLYDRLYHLRSDVPAITHIDYSARIQSVSKNTNERYWKLIKAYKDLTGYGLVVNTSFNVRGEPIICTPEDAYRCFMRTEMDYLVMENFLLDKKEPAAIRRGCRLAEGSSSSTDDDNQESPCEPPYRLYLPGRRAAALRRRFQDTP